MRSTGGSRVLWLVVIADVLTAAVALLTNLATEVVPASWRPYLWIAWPVLAVLVVAGIVVAIRIHHWDGGAGRVSGERAAFSRRAMLARLRTVWVEGVLDRSLYRRTIVELGLTERPDLLKRPWDILVDVPDEQSRPLDRDTALVDVLERHRGLLVLGAPGAGKTTMLLTFLEDLLDRAARDDIGPIPVVFQLASWPSDAKPLAEWFVGELCGPLYGLAPDLARDWIANDRVLPLLDGLDEVALDHRLACARAIDDFHRAHRILPLIVSSRIADYDALGLRLSLDTALVIQPLTRTQTEDYLDRLGEPLAGLRDALDREQSLWELLRTPFLLNVAVRAYHGLPAADVSAAGALEGQQAHLLAAFVDRALRRRQAGPRVRTSDAVRMLAFVARALGQKLESYFFLETVDAQWLPGRLRRVVKVSTAIPSCLLFGGAAGLVMGLFFGTLIGTIAGVLAAAGVGVVLGTADEPRLRYSSGNWRGDLADDLVSWGVVGSAVAAVGGFLGSLVGAVAGAVVGLGLVIAGSGPFLGALVHGALVGAVAGALLGLGIGAGTTTPVSVRSGLRDRPSGAGLRDAAWFCVAFSAIVGVPAGAVLGVVHGSAGLVSGLVVGLAAGYGYSGRGLLAYWLTRMLLARAGIIPAHLRRFLDLAVDRMLMLKVGGGRMFVHRLLLEYFAGLEPLDVPRSHLHDGLPAVDLRPHVLLARAQDEARERFDSIVGLLSYTGSIMPAKVWAPAALRIAELLEERLPEPPALVADAPFDPWDTQVAIVLDVLRMIVAAEHAELSPVAAIRFGELVARESWHDSMHARMRLGPRRTEATRILESIVASDDVAVAAAAAETLTRLNERGTTGPRDL
ncbi:MAG TPA: hypothetical protein VHV74_06525 [Pseudonocardiaceae bacterium]|jgi:hypothetical protein|nr:hypothetical protein [Pseudonocardiaceae bacterium]